MRSVRWLADHCIKDHSYIVYVKWLQTHLPTTDKWTKNDCSKPVKVQNEEIKTDGVGQKMIPTYCTSSILIKLRIRPPWYCMCRGYVNANICVAWKSGCMQNHGSDTYGLRRKTGLHLNHGMHSSIVKAKPTSFANNILFRWIVWWTQ